ncbi:cocaine- and amphetamine-regulated transcript protein-like [Scleropages formosus]|uniref:cocaine- and amphetamine-regulated transcript protein-like n=1 Tax=Scleropages formosus TaxID=113540 RepID=UPI00087853C9|nr:cocaine- and amphetamine-regulated transcript protein-like [Scleropages formosus]
MAKLAVIALVLGSFLCALSARSRAEGTDDESEHKRELLDVLHNVLEKLQNRRMGGWERKTSRLPVCYIGDFCSVKKGSRFGQLCDCPRGSKCNFFFLKCL